MSAYLGVDWGTHSSKWAFQKPGLNPLVGPIWDSAVSRRAERHHVHERGRGRCGLPDERQRIARVQLDAVVVAPQQPDGTAVEHVDGGDNCELLYQRGSMLTRWHQRSPDIGRPETTRSCSRRSPR